MLGVFPMLLPLALSLFTLSAVIDSHLSRQKQTILLPERPLPWNTDCVQARHIRRAQSVHRVGWQQMPVPVRAALVLRSCAPTHRCHACQGKLVLNVIIVQAWSTAAATLLKFRSAPRILRSTTHRCPTRLGMLLVKVIAVRAWSAAAATSARSRPSPPRQQIDTAHFKER